MAYSPTSVTSAALSIEDISEDQLLPASLAAEELQLALNKEARETELQAAIQRCKELVLDCDKMSPERKWLVRHLIELRLRLEECKEANLDPEHPKNKRYGVSHQTVRGHHLVLQPYLKNTLAKYCDHCTGSIWHLVQAWYQCEDCGYSCHYKCMEFILRECAHVVASEKGMYEMNICPEEGLSAQKYQCIECKTPLHISQQGAIWPECDIRRCDYTGYYYCTACHWDSQAVIPARIIHNWDFQSYPVSQASLQLLKVTARRPLINLEKLNPRLFSLIHELDLVKRNRAELAQMRKYLLVCRNAQSEHFLAKSLNAPHLIETLDLYSLQDLVDCQSGELPSKLHNLIGVIAKHIKLDCDICRGRGHICEICHNDEVLYPFDDNAYTCKECNAVYHKNCFERKKNQCLKCSRISKRLEHETQREQDDHLDFDI